MHHGNRKSDMIYLLQYHPPTTDTSSDSILQTTIFLEPKRTFLEDLFPIEQRHNLV